ncbi:hypothetical protein D9M69_568970 [compost metagenome]
MPCTNDGLLKPCCGPLYRTATPSLVREGPSTHALLAVGMPSVAARPMRATCVARKSAAACAETGASAASPGSALASRFALPRGTMVGAVGSSSQRSCSYSCRPATSPRAALSWLSSERLATSAVPAKKRLRMRPIQTMATSSAVQGAGSKPLSMNSRGINFARSASTSRMRALTPAA